MPPEIGQRARYGFEVWWGYDPEVGELPLPDLFIDMLIQMHVEAGAPAEVELPPYFKGVEYILTGNSITPLAAQDIYNDELLAWSAGPPLVAVDGRILAKLHEDWILYIEERLDALASAVHAADASDVSLGLTTGYGTLNDLYATTVLETNSVTQNAYDIGTPTYPDGYPMYVVMPEPLLYAWAQLYIESQQLLVDAVASKESGEATGLIQQYFEVAKAAPHEKPGISGPAIIGIAAIGLAAVGMVAAIWTGRVSP